MKDVEGVRPKPEKTNNLRVVTGADAYRHVPYDIDVEQALLGTLLIDSNAVERVAPILRPDQFYDPLHERLFAALVSLNDEIGITPLTLHAQMKADPGLIEVGGLSYLANLAACTPALPNVRDYARILHDLWVRRALIHIGEDIVNTAYEAPFESSPHAQVQAGEAALQSLWATARANGMSAGDQLSVPILDFLKTEMPARRILLAPWLQSSCLAMVHAWRGIGKTHVGIGVACAVATGSSFLKWKSERPARVLYVDGEMPGVPMQERFRAALGNVPEPDYLRIITPDALPDKCQVPNLLTDAGQAAIEHDLRDREFVIFDNVATLFRTNEDQNAASAWIAAQDYILRLRRLGLAVLLIDHDSKAGGNRGTSAKHDVLDTVIQLKQPSDYRPSQGARFEVSFTKHRGFWGRDTLPFEAQLTDGPTGLIWAIADSEDTLRDRLAEMLRNGIKERVIREELGIGGSKLARLKLEIENRGKEKA